MVFGPSNEIWDRRNGPSWLGGQNTFQFTGMAPGSRVTEVWTFPGTGLPHELQSNISDSGVEQWLKMPSPTRGGQEPVAGLRLIEVANLSSKDEIPIKQETLELLFEDWGLSRLENSLDTTLRWWLVHIPCPFGR